MPLALTAATGVQVAALLRWQDEHDDPLVDKILRRRSSLSRIADAVVAEWTANDPDGRERSIGWLVRHLAQDDRGITRVRSMVLTNALDALPAGRYRFLDTLVEALRPYETSAAGDGWAYLLTSAAAAAFHARRPQRSLELADDAWVAAIERLPPGAETAGALTRIATQATSALCYLPDQFTGRYLVIIDRLEHARAVLLGGVGAGSSSSTFGVLNVALSEANLWRQATRRHAVGFLTGAQHELDVLLRGLRDYAISTGTAPEVVDADPLASHLFRRSSDVKLGRTLGRVAAELTNAAATIGDLVLARRAGAAARACNAGVVHRLDVDLTLARIETNHRLRVQLAENVVRTLADGGRRINPGQRSARLARASQMARDLSGSSIRLKQITASRFWDRQAAVWLEQAHRAEEDGAVPRTAPPAPPLVPEPANDTSHESSADTLADSSIDSDEAIDAVPAKTLQVSKRTDIRGKIAVENPLALVHALMHLARLIRQDDADLAAARMDLDAADAWRPRLRASLRAYPRRTGEDVEELARYAVELADEFAQGYARHMRPELLAYLWRQRDLPIEDRLGYVEDAIGAAVDAGRFRYHMKALAEAVDLYHQLGRPDDVTRTAVAAINAVHEYAASSANSTACVDSATQAAQKLAEIAAWLGERGYDQLAFAAAHASSGWLGALLARTPSLGREFEVYEELLSAIHKGRTEDEQRLQCELLDSMLKRVLDGGPMITSGAVRKRQAHRGGATARTSARFFDTALFDTGVVAPESAVVQLITSREYVLAVGSAPGDSGGRRYFATRLKLTVPQLARLRVRLEIELRPGRARRKVHRPEVALRMLHELVVAPVLEHTAGAGALVFVLHGRLRALPLHAALGSDRYLIESHDVSYLSNTGAPTADIRGGGREAAVGGWDPEISAPEEARAITATLDKSRIRVVRWNQARVGLEHLLDRDAQYSMLHLATHGRFHGWPESSQSRLDLSNSVTLTAADWLREGCSADFVFLNACSIGNSHTLPGDLEGFPLALRVRGVRTVVVALGDIPAEEARDFATTFYQELRTTDSITALRQASRAAIAAGRHASAWAHYVHDGPAFRLTDLERVTADRAGRGRPARRSGNRRR